MTPATKLTRLIAAATVLTLTTCTGNDTPCPTVPTAPTTSPAPTAPADATPEPFRVPERSEPNPHTWY